MNTICVTEITLANCKVSCVRFARTTRSAYYWKKMIVTTVAAVVVGITQYIIKCCPCLSLNTIVFHQKIQFEPSMSSTQSKQTESKSVNTDLEKCHKNIVFHSTLASPSPGPITWSWQFLSIFLADFWEFLVALQGLYLAQQINRHAHQRSLLHQKSIMA